MAQHPLWASAKVPQSDAKAYGAGALAASAAGGGGAATPAATPRSAAAGRPDAHVTTLDAVNRLGRIVKGYLFWTYERGSVHYDVMVTLILAFVFITPRFINFNDKPIERTPHQTGVLVAPDGENGFIYQVESSAVQGGGDAAIRASLQRVIEPIAGEVVISRYEAVKDAKGRITAYRAWVLRR